MAGGVGGAGGSSNGANGNNGASQPLQSSELAIGGSGGDNGAVFIDGRTSLGPYGQGGRGSDTNGDTSEPGKPGAVIFFWGGGVSRSAQIA